MNASLFRLSACRSVDSCFFSFAGVSRPGAGCVGGGVRRVQRVRVRIRANRVWKNLHHDGKSSKWSPFEALLRVKEENFLKIIGSFERDARSGGLAILRNSWVLFMCGFNFISKLVIKLLSFMTSVSIQSRGISLQYGHEPCGSFSFFLRHSSSVLVLRLQKVAFWLSLSQFSGQMKFSELHCQAQALLLPCCQMSSQGRKASFPVIFVLWVWNNIAKGKWYPIRQSFMGAASWLSS